MKLHRTDLMAAGGMLVLLLIVITPVSAAEPDWTYSSSGGKISSVSVSRSGSEIAVGAYSLLLLSRSGELLGRESYGEQVILTPDGTSLLSSYLSTIHLFGKNSSLSRSPFTKIWEIGMINSVRSIDISDDGKTIVVSVRGKGTYIYTSAGKRKGGDDQFNAVVRVSAKGEQIAGVSQDGLCLYTSPEKRGRCLLFRDIIIISPPDFMEITAAGDRVVFNDDQKIVSVALNTRDVLWSRMASGDVTALAMTPSGSCILAGTARGTVDLYDRSGNLSWTCAASPAGTPAGAGVTGVALSDDGSTAVAGTYEGKIVALDTAGRELWSYQAKDHIRSVAISGDGSLVTAAGEGTVYAFSSSARSRSPDSTPTATAGPLWQNNVTTGAATTLPQMTAETTRAPLQPGTPAPTTYSVIRTPAQGPVPVIVPLLGIPGGLLLLRKRR